MYQEYANMQGYNVVSLTGRSDDDTAAGASQPGSGYDLCLTRLLTGLLERPDQKEGSVLTLTGVCWS